MREFRIVKNANTSYIQSRINFDWKFLLQGANVNEKINFVNECLKGIFYNIVQNEIMKRQ